MESMIAKIHKDKMNSICFDCGVENPKFVSINNGIFLCNKCATVHMSFPQGVSNIENNDLYSLSEKELKFLAEGGNTSLNDFILDEFPKLENYSQKLLYKTRAMDYYRKRLYYYIFGGIEPKRPSSIVGCQLIPDNHYIKDNYERNNPQRFEPKTKTYKPEEHVKSTKYKEEFDDFFNDPFMNPDKFGNEKDMFKKFFGKDFFGMENDDFFNFDRKKNLNKTTYEPMTKTQYQYQERPKNQYTTSGYNDRNRNTNNYSNNTYNSNTYNINEKQPMDNYSKRAGPYTSNYVYRSQRPSASSTTTVPSRKDKYMKRDLQNDNSDKKNNNNNEQVNQNINRGGTVNPMKYMKSSYRTQYSKPDEKEKEAEREKEREEREREREERERKREEREREREEREREREEREREREREEREREREERERERERERKGEREKREREREKENQKETTNRYNTNNNDNNNKKSYDPFKRRDSTDLIALPGVENSNLLQKNKKKQKPQEIPSEFSKQASGLGQIADAINENDNESISSQSNSISNSNSDSENNQDENEFSEELKKIPENNTHKKVENNNNGEEDDITFKNSIRNKYKKRKSQIELEKKQEEEKLKAKARPINNNTVYESKYNKKNIRNENNNNDNIKKKPSKKNNEFKSKKSGGIHNDGEQPQFNKSYARRLSKMNITSSNWNINQLGDINTYPEVIEVEGLIFY